MSLDVVDDENIWVVERAGSLRLVFESGEPVLVDRQRGRQDLNSYFAMHRFVISAIHLSHSALADLRADFVTTEFGAGAQHHYWNSNRDYFTLTASVSSWELIRVRRYGPMRLAASNPAAFAAASWSASGMPALSAKCFRSRYVPMVNRSQEAPASRTKIKFSGRLSAFR